MVTARWGCRLLLCHWHFPVIDGQKEVRSLTAFSLSEVVRMTAIALFCLKKFRCHPVPVMEEQATHRSSFRHHLSFLPAAPRVPSVEIVGEG